MDKMFDNPWILRLTALTLACVLFFYVAAENDSNVNSTSSEQVDVIKDIPVDVYYDDANLIVTGLPKTVNVTVKGPFQFVLQAKALKDFTVFADLRQLTMGEHQVKLQVENISEKLEVTLDPAVVDVMVEEKVTKEFRVDPEMNNSLISDEYVLTGMLANPATVFVTGAKSTIDSISYVKATVTEEGGLTKSFEQDSNVKVLDRDLNRLDVAISPEVVGVAVNIEAYSKEVPLVMQQSGSPQTGVTVDELTLTADTVQLTGKKAKLDQLEAFPVDIDMSKITESKNYEIELVLPEGVTSVTPKKVQVQAKVTVEEQTPTQPTTESDVPATEIE